MKIEDAEFVADITGASLWTTFGEGLIVAWPDRAPSYYERNDRNEWEEKVIAPADFPVDTVMDDSGRVVWRKWPPWSDDNGST